MSRNTFGQLFRLTTFGESHGPAMGSIVDGCPAGVPLTLERIERALARRRPGQSAITTSRAEADQPEILSGVFEGRTLGTPIAVVVRNQDQRSGDYDALKSQDRPGHADAVWRERFKHRDHRGGGRSSGRETLCRVIGGSIAEALLERELPSVRVTGFVSQVGTFKSAPPEQSLTRDDVDRHPTRCPDTALQDHIQSAITQAKADGDSLGGSIDVRITGLPVGLGEPVFGKLKALLADAFAGVGAVSGVTWGAPDWLEHLQEPGSSFHARKDNYGGIQGGMSNGEPVLVRAYFKPPATLGEHARNGRHDPCILPRAVPVLEAMASLVLADLYLSYLSQPHRP